MIIRQYELPIMVCKEDDGHYYPKQSGVYNKFIPPSKLENIVNDLIFYYEHYSDEEIELLNKQIENNFDNFMQSGNSYISQNKKEHSQEGFVYVLTCADKYKIGYSNNVERRIRQLDTRPFELNLLLKGYSDKAYTIEQELHKRLQSYKVIGEWYNNLNMNVNDIKIFITKVAEDLKCDIQFWDLIKN